MDVGAFNAAVALVLSSFFFSCSKRLTWSKTVASRGQGSTEERTSSPERRLRDEPTPTQARHYTNDAEALILNPCAAAANRAEHRPVRLVRPSLFPRAVSCPSGEPGAASHSGPQVPTPESADRKQHAQGLPLRSRDQAGHEPVDARRKAECSAAQHELHTAASAHCEPADLQPFPAVDAWRTYVTPARSPSLPSLLLTVTVTPHNCALRWLTKLSQQHQHPTSLSTQRST